MGIIRYGTLILITLLISCGNRQTDGQVSVEKLTATEFAEKIAETGDGQLIDVRTPDEYEKGHIEDAVNINWNDDAFADQVALLDPEKPVFVYCLSGGRSGQAVAKLEESGFKRIYEMPGGMMEWRANNLPEHTETETEDGMTVQQYQELLQSDKLVLIDFYADWCAPCKKMEPFLHQIAEEMDDRLLLVRIDADANPTLCEELGVDALPFLKLYRAGEMIWKHVGFIDEEGLRKQL